MMFKNMFKMSKRSKEEKDYFNQRFSESQDFFKNKRDDLKAFDVASKARIAEFNKMADERDAERSVIHSLVKNKQVAEVQQQE